MSPAVCTWYPLPHRGVIAIDGGDRVRWLNGMITNEVADLGGEHNVRRALLLSRQGRVLADFYVVAWEESLWLELEGEHVPAVIEHLDRYIIADDVELADRRADFARAALVGAPVREAVASVAEGPLPSHPGQATKVAIGDVDAAVAAYTFGVHDELQFFVAPADVPRLAETLGEVLPGLEYGDVGAWNVARIEAGTPRLGFELDDSVLPDEAGLGEAVSTTKGCYTGQEVIARLRSRGTLKHRLVGLRFASEAQLGDTLTAEGKRIGEVTSVTESPGQGFIGLGYVKAEHSAPGEQLDSSSGRVEVADVPFERP